MLNEPIDVAVEIRKAIGVDGCMVLLFDEQQAECRVSVDFPHGAGRYALQVPRLLRAIADEIDNDVREGMKEGKNGSSAGERDHDG